MIGHPKGDPRPIGVFDSGVGGVSVLRALTKRLPRERFVYFGDSANAPYGVKSKEQILHLSREAVKRLCAFDVKAIVIACNTATAASAEELRLAHPNLPILGVEPAIRPAALSASHPKVSDLSNAHDLENGKVPNASKGACSPCGLFRTALPRARRAHRTGAAGAGGASRFP